MQNVFFNSENNNFFLCFTLTLINILKICQVEVDPQQEQKV